ncbi:hypothetical protein [[Micrococcus luteus] ATCC 49442]|uniref:hypothetical protein n=1 Tax=[Micrococcus luteus] ATCC 49442 TaxID=2698727 RepID=UPI0013D99D1B|nr:hypothetical protein [[Micrococcus luteus] ATCC 49442]
MPENDESYLRASAEANDVFGSLLKVVQERIDQGNTRLSVLDVAREARLEIDEKTLAELHLPEFIPVHPFLTPSIYFPWRPLWCWWWRFNYPWYRCCPYWWYRCHWQVG